MPFLGLNPTLGKKTGLTKLLPIYFGAYPSVASIGYAGTPLSSAVLTAGVVRNRSTRATVAGTFSFADALSTVPPASQKSIAIKFTPTNAAALGYPATITVYVGLSVNRTTPTISVYPTLSTIQYGSPKSAVVFSGGVASCPGTFSFANTLNRVLDPAIYVSLECIFTPTDTLNFRPIDFLSPNNLTVAKRQTSLLQYPTISGGGFGQPLSNFTINIPSNKSVVASDGSGGLTPVASVTGYSFISSPSKIITGSTSEGIACSISNSASSYYLPPPTFFAPMPVFAPAPVMAGWDIKTSQTVFLGNDFISQNQVGPIGSSVTSAFILNAQPNPSGASSSSGYRWYGKSGIFTLADAQTTGSYINLEVRSSNNFNKVITGMTPTLFGRSSGAPSRLALLYSDDNFSTPGRTISFDVTVPASGNNDLSSGLAGSLASNPVTILAGRTGYFRLYYYGQTSTTAFLMLLGNTSLDIGFIGYEVQQFPNLLTTGRCSWFRPGINSSTNVSGASLQYWIADSSLSPISISGLGGPSDTSLRPVYVRDGINGLPSVSFSSGQYLAAANNSVIGAPGTSYTVIFVAKFNTADGTIYSEGTNGYWLGSISGGAAICEANRNIVVGGPQSSITNSAVVITAKKLPGNLNYLYVNGNLVSNTQGTISPFTNPIDNPLGYQLTSAQAGNIFSFGAITNGAPSPVSTPYFFNGLLGEMFFFDRNLIDSDRIRIEDYLRLKYLPNQCDDINARLWIYGVNAAWNFGPRTLTRVSDRRYEYGAEVVFHDGTAWEYYFQHPEPGSPKVSIKKVTSDQPWPWLVSWGEFTAQKLCLPAVYPAYRGGDTIYYIGDRVSHNGGNYVCIYNAGSVGYGPFGGFLTGAENGIIYWEAE